MELLKKSSNNKKLISKILYEQAKHYDMLHREDEDMDEQEYDIIINRYKMVREI